MKSNIILVTTIAVLLFILIGCGGGSGSGSGSSVIESTANTPSPLEQFSTLAVNPLTDLGLDIGDQVCFSVKSYNNVTESDFSKAICSQIKDNDSLTLAWNNIFGNINGYYIYFGTNKFNTTNFLNLPFNS